MYAAKLQRARAHGILPIHYTTHEVADLLTTVTRALDTHSQNI